MSVTISVDFTLDVDDPKEAYRLLTQQLGQIRQGSGEQLEYSTTTYVVYDEEGTVVQEGYTDELVKA